MKTLYLLILNVQIVLKTCKLTPNSILTMKKFYMYIVSAGTLILLFNQCQQKGSYATIQDANGNQVISCNISEISDSIDFPLSDLIDACEMVQLETNESSLFERVWHIGVSDHYIAIHSYGQLPVKLFDRQGKFIRDIGAIGHGPGEYSTLYGIQIDEPGDRIYLTPFAMVNKILVYDLNGNYIKDIPLLYSSPKCKTYVRDDIVTILSMPFDSIVPVAYQQSTEGKLIQKLPLMSDLILRPDFSSEISSSHNSDGYDIHILGWGSENCDTLYHYDPVLNRLIPKYVNSFTGERQGSWVYELRRHYWSWLFGDYNGKKAIVDKETLKADFFRLVNDFYGNIEIKEFFMSNNGMFVGSVAAINLIDEINHLLGQDINNDDKDKLTQILESLDENDNAILFIGEMK